MPESSSFTVEQLIPGLIAAALTYARVAWGAPTEALAGLALLVQVLMLAAFFAQTDPPSPRARIVRRMRRLRLKPKPTDA